MRTGLFLTVREIVRRIPSMSSGIGDAAEQGFCGGAAHRLGIGAAIVDADEDDTVIGCEEIDAVKLLNLRPLSSVTDIGT